MGALPLTKLYVSSRGEWTGFDAHTCLVASLFVSNSIPSSLSHPNTACTLPRFVIFNSRLGRWLRSSSTIQISLRPSPLNRTNAMASPVGDHAGEKSLPLLFREIHCHSWTALPLRLIE